MLKICADHMFLLTLLEKVQACTKKTGYIPFFIYEVNNNFILVSNLLLEKLIYLVPMLPLLFWLVFDNIDIIIMKFWNRRLVSYP